MMVVAAGDSRAR